MLRTEAESYAALEDMETAEKLFKELVKRFPNNVWGYIDWGDMYCGFKESKIPANYDKADEIYRMGLTRCNTELEVIYERLEDLEKKENHTS